MSDHDFTVFATRHGHVALGWSARGVSGLRLPSATAWAAEAALLKRLPGARRAAPPPSIAKLVADIVRYFEGEKIDFAEVAVDLGAQSGFFSEVYAHIRKMGWGRPPPMARWPGSWAPNPRPRAMSARRWRPIPCP